jgi:3-oxoacyl-[acyl-carrier-protein] synthase II
MGVVSPLGNDVATTWRRVRAGESGIGPITKFDCSDFPTKIAGEVRDFDATSFLKKRQLRQMDVFIQYALAAAGEAIEQSGLKDAGYDPERIGVYVGAGLGGITTLESTKLALLEKGPRHGISPYFVPALIINLAPGQISLHHGFKGPNFSHVSACSTGAHSIGEAARLIERGDADAMLAGGCEATVTPLGIGGFNSARALSTRNDAPTKASRPFDKDRDGFVLAEGAGLLTLEAMDRAEARGAKILGELVGYAANSDAHHITQPSPGGEGAQRCMRLALADAGVEPQAIGYVNAHGTSTVADRIETNAIREVFGKHAYAGLAVSSTKSMHGHLLGAAGGLEAAITCLALSDQIAPPTINLDEPEPECDLDYVPHTSRELALEYAMSNSFGFGGTNAALVFKRYGA